MKIKIIFYKWRNRYRSLSTPIRNHTQKDYDSLSRHEKKLENKLNIMRLSGFLSKVPLSEKLTAPEVIHAVHPEFSVYELCKVLDIFRGTFLHSYMFRRADPSKQEAAYHREYTSERSFQQSADRYVKFFNEQRPHQTLGYLMPCHFEANYYQKEK